MNTERAILKSDLSDLKMRKIDLETKISANIQATRNALAGAKTRPIDRIDLKGAMVHLSEAAAQKEELEKVKADIATIEEELE